MNFFQIGCSEQSNKTHNFQKNHFCDIITLELYYVVPENIHTSPTEGLGNWLTLIVENFHTEQGLDEHHNFPEGFLSEK